jgi:hypothetical protein
MTVDEVEVAAAAVLERSIEAGGLAAQPSPALLARVAVVVNTAAHVAEKKSRGRTGSMLSSGPRGRGGSDGS